MARYGFSSDWLSFRSENPHSAASLLPAVAECLPDFASWMPGRVWRRTFTQWAILNTQVILRSSDLLIFKSPLSLSGRLITFAVVPKTPTLGTWTLGGKRILLLLVMAVTLQCCRVGGVGDEPTSQINLLTVIAHSGYAG